MREELISFETAKLAKEKGFIEVCEKVYGSDGFLYTPSISGSKLMHSNILEDGSLSASTQSVLQRWLREVHKIHITVFIMERWLEDGNSTEVCFDITIKKQTKLGGLQDIPSRYMEFKTHEEALEKGLQEALRLVKIEEKPSEENNRQSKKSLESLLRRAFIEGGKSARDFNRDFDLEEWIEDNLYPGRKH